MKLLKDKSSSFSGLVFEKELTIIAKSPPIQLRERNAVTIANLELPCKFNISIDEREIEGIEEHG